MPRISQEKTREDMPRRGRPNPVDEHVGKRVRLRRQLLGMSQEKLGGALGLTFQQVQKYERGANRIGASRLFEMSRVLDVPVAFFFEEMDGGSDARRPRRKAGINGFAEDGAVFESDVFSKRETLELVRAYNRIGDASVRKRLFDLMKACAVATEVEAPVEEAAE